MASMLKLLKSASKAIAILAILLGSVAKYAPNLFFKVPEIGFILYAMTGGKPIPPFIVNDPYLPGNTDWLKPKDVIVSVAAKSGTTWMLFCAHQIRVKGNDEKYPYVDVNIATPWPELIQTPGEGWDVVREKMNTTILEDGTKFKDLWDHPDYPFRVFKSHEHAETFEKAGLIGDKSDIKFLAMARNGLDMVASMVPFFGAHSDDFRKIWGNFPPRARESMEEEASARMQEMLPGGVFSPFYFEYINSWWKVRNEKNVLLLHYSDAKKDLSGTVSRLASFYEVELTKDEHATVVEKCGFEYMKKHTDMFTYALPLNPDFKGKKIMTSGSMTRKGIIGDGKVTFSDEEKEVWAKAEVDKLGDEPAKLNWARNGGGEF